MSTWVFEVKYPVTIDWPNVNCVRPHLFANSVFTVSGDDGWAPPKVLPMGMRLVSFNGAKVRDHLT